MRLILLAIILLMPSIGALAAMDEINNSACYTPKGQARMFDFADEIAVRDAVESQIGGQIDRRHVALSLAVAADVVSKRAALAKISIWAATLPESRIKKAYLCAIERQDNALDDAAQELVTHKFQQEYEAKNRPPTIPLPPK